MACYTWTLCLINKTLAIIQHKSSRVSKSKYCVLFRPLFQSNNNEIMYFRTRFHSSCYQSSRSIWEALVQLIPMQPTQTLEQVSHNFLQVHLFVLQSDLQEHLIIFKRGCGAGLRSDMTGDSFPSVTCQPRSHGSISCLPIHCWTWWYTRKQWYLAALDVGGSFWGSTKTKLVATFSQNFWYRRQFKFPSLQP